MTADPVRWLASTVRLLVKRVEVLENAVWLRCQTVLDELNPHAPAFVPSGVVGPVKQAGGQQTFEHPRDDSDGTSCENNVFQEYYDTHFKTIDPHALRSIAGRWRRISADDAMKMAIDHIKSEDFESLLSVTQAHPSVADGMQTVMPIMVRQQEMEIASAQAQLAEKEADIQRNLEKMMALRDRSSRVSEEPHRRREGCGLLKNIEDLVADMLVAQESLQQERSIIEQSLQRQLSCVRIMKSLSTALLDDDEEMVRSLQRQWRRVRWR